MRISIVFCLVFACFAEPIQAEPGALFEPASVSHDKYSLAHQIQFPHDYKGSEDFSVSVACTVHVTRAGKLRWPFCLGGDDKTRPFEKRVIRATERALMTPAKVDGRTRPVVVKFTTIFLRQNGVASVSVVPHQFLNAAHLGLNYVAPQLLTSKLRGYPRTCRGINVILRITVDVNGAASKPQLHLGDNTARSCIQQAMDRVARFDFVPGHFNGVATEMDHLYLVGWRGGWAALDRFQ
jgi:hypothetical protein